MAAPAPKSVLNFRSLAGALMSRARFGGRDGLSFNGARDMYTALGYKRELTAEDFYSRYLRDGVAHRIVEAFPTASWRGGGEIYEDPDPDTITKFEQAWKDLNERLDIWGTFERLDIVSGIGRYGVLLIGAPGALDTPLEKVTADKIMYLRTYSELDAPVQQLDQDPESARFGEPTFYNLNRSTLASLSGVTGTATARRVHFSRVIHVAEGLLDNNVVGQSRIEKVWNLLDDLMKVSGGGAEAHFKRADGGLQLALDPEIVLDAAGKLALEEQIESYTHGLERIIRTQGVEMNRLGSDVADFKGPIGAIFDLISASTGIPQRILMGSERGELASSNDQSNWDTRVSDRRQNFCYKHICRPFVNRLIELKALPTPKEYVADWPEIEELTEGEKIEAASKLDAMPQANGIIVLPTEIRENYLGLPPFTPEQLKEIEAIEAKKKAAAEEAMQQQQEAGDQQKKASYDQLPVMGDPEEPKTLAARTQWERDGDGKFGSGPGDPNVADDDPAPGPGWVKLMKGGWVPPSHPDAAKGIGRSPGTYDPKHVVRPKTQQTRKPLRSNLERLHAAMGDDEKESLRKGFDRAKDEGFAGDESEFLQEQLELYGKAKEGDPRLKTWFSAATMTRFDAERQARAEAEKMAKHKKAAPKEGEKPEPKKDGKLERERVESQPNLHEVVAVLAMMDDDERLALHEAYDSAIAEGFAGNEQTFLMQQLELATTTEEGDAELKTQFGAAAIQAYTIMKMEKQKQPEPEPDPLRTLTAVLSTAIADGRRVLNAPAFRSAMVSGDHELVRQLLAQSVDKVEAGLRA